MTNAGNGVDSVRPPLETPRDFNEGSGMPQDESLASAARFMKRSSAACLFAEGGKTRDDDDDDDDGKGEATSAQLEVAVQQDTVQRFLQDVRWSAEELLSLNVGGDNFTISHRTLRAVPDSMLALLANSWLNVERDATGSLYLDRSPHLFRDILAYLRLKAVPQVRASGTMPPMTETARVQRAGEHHDEADEDVEEAIVAHLVQTSWRHMTSRHLQEIAAEANYYNLRSLQTHLLMYCQRRWVEYGAFVVSCVENIEGDKSSPIISSSSLSLSSSSSSSSSQLDPVLCISYDDKSGVCAAGRGSGVVIVYFLPSFAQQNILRGHTSCVTAVVVTPTRIFSSGRDGFIWVWHNIEDFFSPICSLRAHQGFANALLLLPERLSLLSCGEDDVINVFHLPLGCHRPVMAGVVATPGPVRCLVAYHQYVFAACLGMILMLDVAQGGELLLPHRGRAHDAPIRCLAVSEHNGLLASGGWDGALYLWSVRDVTTDSCGGANNAREETFTPLYALARFDSCVTHVLFVGGLLGASCGSEIHFFGVGATPQVVRSIRSDGGALVRVFLAVESANCLLVGKIDGNFFVLHSRIFPEKGAMEEKGCQWGESLAIV